VTDYVKSTNFTSKDSLATGNPLKIVKGAEFDTEFNAIAVAVASKADSSSPALSGTPTTPTAVAGTNNTQIASTAFVQTAVNSAVITGEMKMWPTSSAPAGYLLCDGSAVSRTVYAALYAVLGTTFGSGDGVNTFNLPNFRNRMPIGAGDLYSTGGTGGSKDATVVSHSHGVNITTGAGGDHNHSINLPFVTTNQKYSGGGQGFFGEGTGTYTTANAGTHTHSVTGTTDLTGSSATNANLPPYLAVNFIIKT